MFETNLVKDIKAQYKFDNIMENYLKAVKEISEHFSSATLEIRLLKEDIERFNKVLKIYLGPQKLVIINSVYDHCTHPYVSSISHHFIRF